MIAIEIDDTLPEFFADAVQLQKILINMMMNALQAIAGFGTDHSAIVVSADFDQPMVTFTVMDSGPGISPQQSETIFEPFQSIKVEGFGLGEARARLGTLSGSKSRVSLHFRIIARATPP